MTRIILSFRREALIVGRMLRCFCLMLVLALGSLPVFSAEDDGPPISITSPDTATTFVSGTIKSRSLLWMKSGLVARITFTDAQQVNGQASDDTQEFRFPGVSYDAAKGVFFATTAKGEVIPVAHYKKVLFIKSIETLPNARVRIIHPRGTVTAILEAISPNDPAMHPKSSDPEGTHQVDINKILN